MENIKSLKIEKPSIFQIEITNRCTLRCIMCIRNYIPRNNGDMPLDKFMDIVFSNPQIKMVDLTGFGEPFLHKNFLEILHTVKSEKIFTSFNTNFMCVTPKIMEEIISIGVDRIIISFDAASKETYEAIRKGADYNKVLDNIKTLSDIKKNLSSSVPEVWINYVVMKNNAYEAPRIIPIASNLGISRVVFTKLIVSEEMKELYPLSPDTLPREALQKCFKDIYSIARKMNIKVDFSLFNKYSVKECQLPWNYCFISYDGDVHPCCFVYRTKFGNVFKNSLTRIWASKEYQKIRKEISKGILPKVCTGCPAFK